MPHAWLVYNPYAGRYPSWLLSERAAQLLRKNGWDIEMKQSQHALDVTKLAREAAELGMDAFYVVGGDGTINLAARGLIGSQTALGVLPGGTANVFAQELGLPCLTWTRITALEESARLLANAQTYWMDVGWCNNTPFLLWLGVGLDAFIIHRIEPRQRWEKHFAAVSYAASAVWHAVSWRGTRMRITVDGREIHGHYLLSLVSNVHLYAGGMAHLSSQARLDDGLLDLWLFEGDTLGDTVQCAWDLLAGRYTNTGTVKLINFRSLIIETDEFMYLQVDGEPLDYDQRRVEIWVQPKALKILVPPIPPRKLFKETMDESIG
jgi:YegS/Rv2252/BmrU family lipid kinase